MKETNEIFDALELIVAKAEKAFADGKIDWDDASIIIELLTEYKTFVDAVTGLKELPAEYKDISEVEALALAARSYKFIKSIVELVKKINVKPKAE
jgi:hypothetical protein